MNKLLVNTVVKLYYPSSDMGIDALVCKVVEESLHSVKVEYAHASELDMSQRTLTKEEVLRGLEEYKDAVLSESNCEDYIDKLWNESFFDEMIQEMKYADDYSSNKMFKSVIQSAHSDGVHLKDIDLINYLKMALSGAIFYLVRLNKLINNFSGSPINTC